MSFRRIAFSQNLVKASMASSEPSSASRLNLATASTLMSIVRGFASTPLRRASDPEELERERKLRENLANGGGSAPNNNSGSSNTNNNGSNPPPPPPPPPNARFGGAPFQMDPKKTFWQNFQAFHEVRNAQRAAATGQAWNPMGSFGIKPPMGMPGMGQSQSTGSAGADGGAGAGSTTGTGKPKIDFAFGTAARKPPTFTKFVASTILLYCAYKLAFRKGGGLGGDLNSTVVPFWISSYEIQAKYMIMLYTMDNATRDRHQFGFSQARKYRPLLTFFDYLDEVDPNWCSGLRHNRTQVLNTMTGALCGFSQWQTVSLANRLSYYLDGSKASTAEKIDILMDNTQKHLGTTRSMVAGLLGGSDGGIPPTLKIENDGQGHMRVMDPRTGMAIPVNPLNQLNPFVLSQNSYPAGTPPPPGTVAMMPPQGYPPMQGGGFPQGYPPMQGGFGGGYPPMGGTVPFSQPAATSPPLAGSGLDLASTSTTSIPVTDSANHGTVPVFKQ